MSVSKHINASLKLEAISLDDTLKLSVLMHRIYPPPYKHLWEDDGYWYVQETFNKTILEKELSEINSAYYFVNYLNETIGVLRYIHDFHLMEKPDLSATKLHRIYVDPKVHGKGIGVLLMDWVTKQAVANGSELLWLEAMDTQQQALRFYKNLGYKIAGDFRLNFELMYEHLRGMHRMYKIL
jgi:GNAT superfamily N-acetyltransferase